MRSLILVIHNVRSAHNVGSMLRSADGFGVAKVYFTGYSPYPSQINDERMPHIRDKVDYQIHKTALGAEDSVAWEYKKDIKSTLNKLKKDGFLVVALEQTPAAITLGKFNSGQNITLVVGNEVDGLDQKTLALCDVHVEIQMRGQKESFNVAVAAAIAMYHFSTFK